MIRGVVLILLMQSFLFAYGNEDIKRDYSEARYKDVCTKSAQKYKNNLIKDENILSIIGDACAKVDFINPLGYIVRGLVSTPEFRENGSYFATLILQKKLIYQFMVDGIDLKELRLPRTPHVLSIVFENLVKKNYTVENESIKKYRIKTDEKEYLIWLEDDEKKVVHVNEIENGKVIKEHWYL